MGLFDDKKYDSMDEISKMIEPWENPFDEIINKLPDRYRVEPDDLMSVITAYDAETAILKRLFSAFLTPEEVALLNNSSLLDREYSNTSGQYSKSLLEVEASKDFAFNLLTKEITGDINIVKTLKTTSETFLKKKVVEYTCKKVLTKYSSDSYLAESMRSVYELITGKPYQSDRRSKKELIYQTREEIRKLFEEDRWRIRSFKLYLKLADWFEIYCTTGDSASFANIMKLKIMTYSGKAIYSIGEEV